MSDGNLIHYGKACPKHDKVVKLKDKELTDQNHAVSQRDLGCCVLCGNRTNAPVHHIEHGTGNRSDELNNKVTECQECHHDYHHGNDEAENNLIKKILKNWGFKLFIQIFLMGYIVYVNKRDR
jgi:hypothetical protein